MFFGSGMWICPIQYLKPLKQKRKRKFLCVSCCVKRKIRQCRQPQGRERQTGSATGYYPMKGSRQAVSRLSIFLKSGLPFENIPSLPPCNKQGLSTRIFLYNAPPLLGLWNCILPWSWSHIPRLNVGLEHFRCFAGYRGFSTNVGDLRYQVMWASSKPQNMIRKWYKGILLHS